MLPAEHRMRHSSQFSATVRSGRRSGGAAIVVHQSRPSGDPSSAGPALVGLVVGKSVGNSVVRHRVSRRLRAQLAQRMDRLPNGSSTVVRALPSAALATSAQFGAELDRALRRMAGAR